MRTFGFLVAASLVAASFVAAPASSFAQERVLRGDAAHGATLFHMECAACHGPDGSGSETWRKALEGKPRLGSLPDLTDGAFLAQRSDDELRDAIRSGEARGRTIPGHAFRNLSTLDVWDLVEWLRRDGLPVEAFFPGAAKFTAKDFEIDQYGQQRLADKLKLKLAQDELSVVVLTVYKGDRAAGSRARLVPWRPVDLDLLSAKDRLGYLSFVDLEVPKTGEKIRVGLGVDTDGKLRKAMVQHPDPAKRAAFEKVLSAFVGQGAKGGVAFTAPRTLRDGALWAKALTRSFGIAAEGVTMYEKAERERTAFDR
ncbi:MAG TPA: c-type cytochrome [Vulgatibacter sp.]|nr:c-type cytochrome [Vulgatibacter sp.]